MLLIELKLWYNRYIDFWPQWKEYKYNGLTSRDLLNIELFRDNNFRIDTGLLEDFHTQDDIKEQLVTPLVVKLQANYAEYKEWVSIKFLLSLVKYGSDYGVHEFFSMPIEKLPIEDEARKNLKSFQCENINALNAKYNEEDFLKEPLFSKLLKFRDFINNAPGKEIFVLDEILAAN